jgi:tRNA pseudouridine55 synthase
MNGILLLNKALGLSSNRAMQQIKRLFGAKKAGHTGSLDPLASGMLPICIGEATKFAQYLLDADKTYEVEGCFGKKTSTGDREGEVVAEQDVQPFSEDVLRQSVESFIGSSEQIPPMYSALKFKGQPLYSYALKGIELEREARTIQIRKIELISYHHPYFKIRVQCSKGTYMRVLIEDIAKRMESIAYVSLLHRVSTAGFDPSSMITLDALEKLSESQRLQYVLPMDVMVEQFPALKLSIEDVLKLQQGKIIQVEPLIDLQIYRLYADKFVGLGQYDKSKGLLVKRMCQY